MWSDIKTLRQYLREALQYKDELDEQKKLEDSQVDGTATEKRKNYNLQIGLAFIALTATPFLQDGYNYAKNLLYDSTGISGQQTISKAQFKTVRSDADSISLKMRDAQSKAPQNNIKSRRIDRDTFRNRLSEK